MRILELTNFSAGVCGVGARVKQEAILLKKLGHDVAIFSSYFVKGSNEIAPLDDMIEGVMIKRFAATKLGGESFINWNFKHEAIAFKPDVIIAHAYRHVHTNKALRLAKITNAKIFLVTHAPFIKDNETRSFISSVAVFLYDKLIARKTLNRFNKVIAITNWERKYLKKLGVKDNRIEYSPNGIPTIFFKKKQNKEMRKLLFFGRISPIKNLEVLIKALVLIEDKKIKLDIVGPAEIKYSDKLKKLIGELGLEKRVNFLGAVYNLDDRINTIDSCKIFILPSKSEAMPQGLIEAMSRGKIVIASRCEGTEDIIVDGKNGILFENGNEKDLAMKIDYVLKNKLKDMKLNAKDSVEKFGWDKVIKDFNKIISN